MQKMPGKVDREEICFRTGGEMENAFQGTSKLPGKPCMQGIREGITTGKKGGLGGGICPTTTGSMWLATSQIEREEREREGSVQR